jgi:hypothetical protein
MNKIKSIRTISSPNDDPEFSIITKEEHFDETGALLEETTYLNDGNIENRTTLKYENGLLVEQCNYIDDNELTEKRTIERDANGKISKELILYLDGSNTVKNYRRKDNYIEIESIDSEEGLESIEKIKIDDSEHILLKEVFDTENNLLEKIENTFEGEKLILSKSLSNNNITIEKLDYNGELMTMRSILTESGKLIQAIKFFYDEKARLKEYVYNSGFRFVNDFNDENNSKIEKQMQANGIIEYQKETFYDENSNITKEIDFQQTTIYEYSFFD